MVPVPLVSSGRAARLQRWALNRGGGYLRGADRRRHVPIQEQPPTPNAGWPGEAVPPVPPSLRVREALPLHGAFAAHTRGPFPVPRVVAVPPVRREPPARGPLSPPAKSDGHDRPIYRLGMRSLTSVRERR